MHILKNKQNLFFLSLESPRIEILNSIEIGLLTDDFFGNVVINISSLLWFIAQKKSKNAGLSITWECKMINIYN